MRRRIILWGLGVLVLVQPFAPLAQAQVQAAPPPSAAVGAGPSVGPNPSLPSAQAPAPYSGQPLPARAPLPVRAPSDTCGASELASLIGQPRTEIPVPADLSRRRVICTSCPRSMDYQPGRLTIFYDRVTSRVTTLQCG